MILTKETWIIIDDKAGNANQAIAVAKAMGSSYETKKLVYNFLASLPNRLKFDSLMGIDFSHSSSLEPPYPDLVISSGRKTAAVSNYIKLHSPKSFVVHLMNPDLDFNKFDLVCLPLHDKSPKHDKYKNIFYTIGAPAFLDKIKIEQEGERLKQDLRDLNGPFICLMIGGKTKVGEYSQKELSWLVTKANALAKSVNGSLLITTSRRTNQNISQALQDNITVPYFLYNWHQPSIQYNPYLGYLSLSDYFIVTGDSVSICSEVLGSGKPVYIYRKNNILYKKHIKFLDYLESLSYTRTLTDKTILEKWDYTPLKEAERLCQIIEERINVDINFSS